MKKTHAVFGAAFLLVTIVGVTTFPTAAASESTDEVLRLKTRTTEGSFLDLGEAGPSLGDQFIFHDVVKRDGERVGRMGGVCTMTSTSGVEGEANCLVTLELPDGQIASQGLVHPTGEFPQSFDVAISGGTGRYEEADGEVHVTETSETSAQVTLHLHL